MDPFTCALAAAHEQDAALQASMALRQDVALSPDLRDTQGSATDTASEDCGNAGEDCTRRAQMSNRWNEEEDQWVSSMRTRQGTEPLRVNQRRKLDVKSLMKVIPVSASAAEVTNVPSVFVAQGGIGKPQLPIPMWPQYTVVWGAFHFGDAKFLSVGSDEHWLVRLIDELSSVKVRTVAKKFVDQFRREFNAQVQLARVGQHSDADEQNARHTSYFKSTRGQETSMIQIKIAETELTCVNTMQRILLKLDHATMRFISSVIAPAIEIVAKNNNNFKTQTRAVRPSIDSSDSQESSQTYQLGFNCTPNLRDKVTWDVSMHTWNVTVQKPTMATVRTNWDVSSSLGPEGYEAQKISMYWEAVKHWNEADGSKRIRITVPPESRTPGSPSDA